MQFELDIPDEQFNSLVQSRAAELATALGCRPEDPKRELIQRHFELFAAVFSVWEKSPQNPPEKSV
jgi:hypothetical protein